MDSVPSEAALKKFTALGDPTFLLLVALGGFFYLWIVPERRRLARDFGFAIGLSILLTVGTKIGLLLVHDPHQTPRLRSPSGHVAIATAVYGSCMMILVSSSRALVRWSAYIATALLLLALAATRWALRFHSGVEIVAGFFIGVASLTLFALAFRKAQVRIDVGQLAALLSLLAVTRFARVDAEEMVTYGVRSATVLLDTALAVGGRSSILGAVPDSKLFESLPNSFE